MKLRNHVKTLKPAIADYVVKKAKQRIALQRWTEELNRKKNHKAMILVENTVDLEGPPLDFYYINEYKPAPGINVLNGITTGCECADCPAEKCCPKEAGFILAYNKRKKLKIQPGLPIYECNSYCRCGPDCPNRIVQKGTPYSLCIFRTNNGRGWGVKTLQKIKTNSFVMEYVGEVITSEEAERRGQFYDNQGNTYLFDLDYDSDEFTVDAARYGNVSHFVNHSCDPNLQVFNVFIDNLDLRLPRIALFSTRTIKAGEELTFDYQMKGTPVDRHCELMVTQEEPDPPTCVEEKPSLGESSMPSKEALNTEDMKMPKDSEVTTEADIKPKSVRRAKTWSDVVENLYRFQQAGYRDEVEYKQVKQVEQVDFWPETGFVKKLQRRDNTFYYYNRQRECEDKDVRKVKIYVY
ncbi:histone-lysine N-methyltransferase SUV39H2 isoform 3-T4 [Ammospiza maritima maritima]